VKKLVPVTRVPSFLQKMHAKELGDLYGSGTREAVPVGIDASLTKYGLSVFGTESKRHTTVLFRPKSKGPARLLSIWEFVTFTINFLEDNFQVSEIVMEDYAMGAKSRAHAIGEGGGATKLALAMYYAVDDSPPPLTLVSPTSLKKFVAGSGNTEKSLIIKKVWQKWGADLDDDNQADAYSLARIGSSLASGVTDHAYERGVLDKLERDTEWMLQK
jgi:crossover junction endodeoxyribonuclease RuvC